LQDNTGDNVEISKNVGGNVEINVAFLQ
jgi:hypothetical protein